MPKRPLAVVTMVHNEPDLLPVWLAHYGRAVGIGNCFVIDHGSTAGLDVLAGVPHVRRLAQEGLDEVWRSAVVSQFCNDLLGDYAHVAYTDVDELLVAGPDHAANLVQLCAAGTPEVLTAFGLDVVQVQGEAPIDFGRPIGAQRRWARAHASLCKPSLVRRPVRWWPGFHYADASTSFGGLYLFHVAYVDEELTRRRQAKRNATPCKPGVSVDHHAIPPDAMVQHIRDEYAKLPRHPAPTLQDAPEQHFVARMLEGGTPRGPWTFMADLWADELWEIPPGFAARF